MTGVAKNTVLKLLVEIGDACSAFLDEKMRNLRCQRLQADEAWSFVGAKQKNVTPANMERGAVGDVWVWAALDADTKLIPSWRIGARDAATARDFMEDLAGRLVNRVQLTTDGHKPYLTAVDRAFGGEIDYAMLVKMDGLPEGAEKRYSPAVCIGCESKAITGRPDPEHINTSYIERQNLTMRMSMRRFTLLEEREPKSTRPARAAGWHCGSCLVRRRGHRSRLTNAFSKKLENHGAARDCWRRAERLVLPSKVVPHHVQRHRFKLNHYPNS